MKDCKLHYTDSIHYELEQTSRLMKKVTTQLFEKLEIGLSIDEYAALDTVSVNAGICQRDLAKLILKDRANTGRILDSLEQKGFITRFIDTKNNRLVKKMGITERGLKELDTINKKVKQYLESVTKKISMLKYTKELKNLGYKPLNEPAAEIKPEEKEPETEEKEQPKTEKQ